MKPGAFNTGFNWFEACTLQDPTRKCVSVVYPMVLLSVRAQGHPRVHRRVIHAPSLPATPSTRGLNPRALTLELHGIL